MAAAICPARRPEEALDRLENARPRVYAILPRLIRRTSIRTPCFPITTISVSKLVGLYPTRRFIWMVGADNLVQVPQWRDWREIARLRPIAVIARPVYNDRARARRAMGGPRRFVRPADQKKHWTDWRPPALVFWRFSPDVRSATAIRQANPRWFERYEGRALRDPLTRSWLVEPTEKGRI